MGLKTVYDNFGSDIKITLNPFVFGSASQLQCFDESAPCTLEQESMNVIESNTQDKYVPWLICMDSNSDNLSKCDSEAGISKPASTVSAATLDKYIKADKPIGSTPTVHINGAEVRTSYSAIHTALCSADPSLKGCSAPMPINANDEVFQFCKKRADIVV